GTFTATLLVHTRIDELVVKVVAFTRTLADTSEYGVTTVRRGNVVDQLLDQNGLAHAGTAEQAELTALGIPSQKVENLDAGDQDLGFRRLFDIGRSRLVDTARLGRCDWTSFVHRLANHVDDAAEHFRANRYRDGGTGVPD